MSTYEFRDESGDARLIGTLHVEGGATGDVPTQQASGELAQAVPGGSTPGAAIVRGPFPFAFGDVGLAAGIAFYTPTIGDVLTALWIVTDTAWDGTTPTGEVGSFAGTTAGISAAYTSGISGLDMTKPAGAVNAGTGIFLPSLAITGSSAFTSFQCFPVFTGVNPLKFCVSQDGLAGGLDPGASQGACRIFIATATPKP